MATDREIKETVRERYAERARSVTEAQDSSYCGSAPTETVISSNLYTTDELQGLPQEAVVASLGCGNPVALAELHAGAGPSPTSSCGAACSRRSAAAWSCGPVAWPAPLRRTSTSRSWPPPAS